MNTFDFIVFHWLHSWIGILPLFDWLFIFFAQYITYVVYGTVIFFFVWINKDHLKDSFKPIFFVFLSAGIARFVVTELVHFMYYRPRPFVVFQNITQLVRHDSISSFPSGHAAILFAMATMLSFYYPKVSVWFFLVSILVGIARIAVGVHWPTDILGGALAGILTVVFLRYGFKKLLKKDDSL